MQLTLPFEAAVVAATHRVDAAMPKRDFFSFHVSARLLSASLLINAERREGRIANLFQMGAQKQQRHEDHEHRRKHGPPLARIPHHFAERVAQRARDHEDRQQLEEVRQRRRVLVRVRGIDVEESAAVGAQLLDRDLRRCGSQRQELLGHFLARGVLRVLCELRRLIRGEALHDPLRNQEHGQHDRQRQQDIQRAARHIDPEVADQPFAMRDGLLVAGGRRRAAAKSTDHRRQHGQTGRGRDEILHGQADHLRQVAHRRFAAVTLPIGVRGKTNGGVERRVGRDIREFLRIQRQPFLRALQAIHDDKAQKVEQQHRAGVHLPIHFLIRRTPARR